MGRDGPVKPGRGDLDGALAADVHVHEDEALTVLLLQSARATSSLSCSARRQVIFVAMDVRSSVPTPPPKTARHGKGHRAGNNPRIAQPRTAAVPRFEMPRAKPVQESVRGGVRHRLARGWITVGWAGLGIVGFAHRDDARRRVHPRASLAQQLLRQRKADAARGARHQLKAPLRWHGWPRGPRHDSRATGSLCAGNNRQTAILDHAEIIASCR